MTTAAAASTEPTDRSIPAVRITKVMPAASTVLIDACCAMIEKFWKVKKLSAKKAEDDDDQDQHRQHAYGSHHRLESVPDTVSVLCGACGGLGVGAHSRLQCCGFASCRRSGSL